MNDGKYVFAQIIQFIPEHVFSRIVETYNGNKHVRHFSCWNQFMCMIFGQLSNRESLRDTVLTIRAHKTKIYHMGFGKSVSKSNLAKANENRDFRIYQDFAYELIAIARKISYGCSEIELSFKGNIYAFDSTTIDLCLNVFWWAKFRSNKGAVKAHTLFDVRTSIPCFVHITTGKIHDVNALDVLTIEPFSFYIFDRGYTDFERLFQITKSLAFFIIRGKDNLKYRRLYSNEKDRSKGIIFDQIIRLVGFYATKDYPEKLRLIKFFDKETNQIFYFITNNFELHAVEIAFLYKKRWQIELFFKWIKQHLKIKSFWGTTPNAVKTQIYIGIISYTLMAIIKSTLKLEKSVYEILQILGISFFDKTPIIELLTNQDLQDFKEPKCKQLTLF